QVAARAISLGFALIALAACAKREPADLVLYGGKVVTVDDAGTIATTVVVKDGRIIAVGGDDDVRKHYDAKAELDLHGHALLPGFVDSHIHVDGHAHRFVQLDKAKSIDEIVALIAAKAKELGPGQWITGFGWSEDRLAEKRRPLVGDLDHAAP